MRHRRRISYALPTLARWRALRDHRNALRERWQAVRERWRKQARRWSRYVALHAVKGAATAAGGIIVGLLWHYLQR